MSATVRVVGGKFLIEFPYDRDLFQQVVDIPQARWDRATSGWLVPFESALDVAQFVVDTKAIVDTETIVALKPAHKQLQKIADSAAHDANIVIKGLGGELLPFQRAGVAYAMKALGFTQTDDGSWIHSS